MANLTEPKIVVKVSCIKKTMVNYIISFTIIKLPFLLYPLLAMKFPLCRKLLQMLCITEVQHKS